MPFPTTITGWLILAAQSAAGAAGFFLFVWISAALGAMAGVQ